MSIFKHNNFNSNNCKKNKETIADLYKQIEYLNKKLTESNKRISNLEQDLAVEQAIKYIHSHNINDLRKHNPCLKCQLKDSCLLSMKDRCIEYQVYDIAKRSTKV